MSLPYHKAVHVNSVMSCHVMNFHRPHPHFGSCIFKIYFKGEVQGTHTEYEESCKLKGHRKSNSHEGSQRVTMRVKHHPWLYINPHYMSKGLFTLAPPTKHYRDKLVL